jgi:hypothetical protein
MGEAATHEKIEKVGLIDDSASKTSFPGTKSGFAEAIKEPKAVQWQAENGVMTDKNGDFPDASHVADMHLCENQFKTCQFN